jgi:hypothetical protein
VTKGSLASWSRILLQTHYKGRTTQFTLIAKAHISLPFLQFTINSPAVH